MDELLASNEEPITVAEIGIGIGATSVEITKRLRETDSYYFFSFKEDVKELNADLRNTDYCKCNLYPMGNSHATYDSYTWNLSSLCLKNNVKFDLAFLDGAHSFFHDALAAVLLKKLIKPGGVLIFDDVFWSHQKSPTQNSKQKPQHLKDFTIEQLETEQIRRVIDLFMENDDEWERIGDIEWETAYRKISP
ncbi:MAG: class I SAM-dependent methyltransferase [Methanobrevibacter sp.]|nr:class I SAM-dependent methyltransferase [Methanobrevibacter sp.]